jgi:hypothetical protein
MTGVAGRRVPQSPVGVLEITEAGTRFILFVDPARLGIAITIGILIGLTIGRRPERRSVVGA